MFSKTRQRCWRYSKVRSSRTQWRLFSGSAPASLRRITVSVCPALNITSLDRITFTATCTASIPGLQQSRFESGRMNGVCAWRKQSHIVLTGYRARFQKVKPAAVHTTQCQKYKQHAKAGLAGHLQVHLCEDEPTAAYSKLHRQYLQAWMRLHTSTGLPEASN